MKEKIIKIITLLYFVAMGLFGVLTWYFIMNNWLINDLRNIFSVWGF